MFLSINYVSAWWAFPALPNTVSLPGHISVLEANKKKTRKQKQPWHLRSPRVLSVHSRRTHVTRSQQSTTVQTSPSVREQKWFITPAMPAVRARCRQNSPVNVSHSYSWTWVWVADTAKWKTWEKQQQKWIKYMAYLELPFSAFQAPHSPGPLSWSLWWSCKYTPMGARATSGIWLEKCGQLFSANKFSKYDAQYRPRYSPYIFR